MCLELHWPSHSHTSVNLAIDAPKQLQCQYYAVRFFPFSLRVCPSLSHILSLPVLHYCSQFSHGLVNCWWFNSESDAAQQSEISQKATAEDPDYPGPGSNMTLLPHFSSPNHIHILDLRQRPFSFLPFTWDSGPFRMESNYTNPPNDGAAFCNFLNLCKQELSYLLSPHGAIVRRLAWSKPTLLAD